MAMRIEQNDDPVPTEGIPSRLGSRCIKCAHSLRFWRFHAFWLYLESITYALSMTG